MLNIHTGGTTEYGDDNLLIEKLNLVLICGHDFRDR